MDLVNHLSDRLLFAVPKKGRLNQACLDLLAGSDIKFHRHNRLDIALVMNLPMALIFLPASDIPISGVQELLDLEFGGCKLQVQVPEKGNFNTPEELVGRKIVTSFTNLSEAYFKDLEAKMAGTSGQSNGDAIKPKTQMRYAGGSVEAACALGVADGIVDLVESGETMRAAGLKAIATVVESTAVLISSKHPSDPKLVNIITNRIKGVITAQKYVLCVYNIERSKLDQASKITPGKRAPTVNSLDEDGWVAVSAMVQRNKIAGVMDELAEIGATDILVTKIDNSRES
ncbi:hypothetical protein KC332_g6839 [Hortaea werneckii]|nr:hypothetical protein KC358_g11739 [Hortaea werneckii]KAI6814702.1 hypothetical protein KC350_g11224 [Hortaea werneckii]KAI6816304.1 hypothetical protein KC342_g15524 [Hortaea werneckii]KAI6935047.1 hypothetical protein KC348_g6343 [Hortaea werneckii]KAI6962561.1 hypothetical protein KC321_g11708 [Hortaea werneckii]